jgi:hypothetical protein
MVKLKQFFRINRHEGAFVKREARRFFDGKKSVLWYWKEKIAKRKTFQESGFQGSGIRDQGEFSHWNKMFQAVMIPVSWQPVPW